MTTRRRRPLGTAGEALTAVGPRGARPRGAWSLPSPAVPSGFPGSAPRSVRWSWRFQLAPVARHHMERHGDGASAFCRCGCCEGDCCRLCNCCWLWKPVAAQARRAAASQSRAAAAGRPPAGLAVGQSGALSPRSLRQAASSLHSAAGPQSFSTRSSMSSSRTSSPIVCCVLCGDNGRRSGRRGWRRPSRSGACAALSRYGIARALDARHQRRSTSPRLGLGTNGSRKIVDRSSAAHPHPCLLTCTLCSLGTSHIGSRNSIAAFPSRAAMFGCS